MTITQETVCPCCGSRTCYVAAASICPHTRTVRPGLMLSEAFLESVDAGIEAERDRVSSLVLENQQARPLRDSDGRAFCRFTADGGSCALPMGHDQGESPVPHELQLSLTEDKGLEYTPNRQVTRRKPTQGVTIK